MGRIFLLFVLSLVSFISVECVSFKQNFENQEITRNLDLRGQAEVVTTQYNVRNIGDEKATSYIVAFPPRERGKLSMVQGYTDNKLGSELVSEEVKGSSDAPDGTRYYKIDLPEPVEPDATIEFNTIAVYIHVLKPFPAEISQGESQHVVYTGDAYSYSIYKTITQRTLATLASKKVEFYTKKKSRQEEDRIEYGPFSDVEAHESSPIKIHYENNSPFAVFKSVVKEIEISHWGNVAVEEKYVLTHTGAKLKGGFSRHEYQQGEAKPSPSFRGIIAQLHPSATDIYYRDEIGNISTSHVRYEEDLTVMEIEPRFPMFGGWKTDFYMGYNLPAAEVLSYKTYLLASPTYVLNITFGCPFPMLVTDDIEVRVIMPEGASNIKWATDFHVDSEDKDVRVTYLDTVGRPVLILRKADVVGIPPRYFQVTYSFSQINMLQEPILLIVAFLAFFAVCMVYVRIDLSLSPKKSVYVSSKVLNRFLVNGDKMMAAYKASDSFTGDAAMRDMRVKLVAVSKKSRSLGSKWEVLLNTIKKNKKAISSGTLEKYADLVKQLIKA